MANTKSSTEATQLAMSIFDIPPIHKPFTWLNGQVEHDTGAQFAARLMDIAAGTKVIAQIMRSHVLDLQRIADGTPEVRPLMSASDIDALAGLAAVVLSDLHEHAAAQVEAIEQKAREGARA